MTTATQAYAAARAQRESKPRKERTPLLVRAGRFAGRYLPSWERARTTVLQLSGLGCIDYGLFEWNPIAGFVGTGISLLVVDAFSGDE